MSDESENSIAHGQAPTGARELSLRRLDVLVGRWEWNGRSKSGDFEVSGWSEFEWLEEGFFLIERSELRSGASVNSHIAIIGYADVSADCVARYYDSEGREDTYTIAVSDRKLIIEWKLDRFAGEFSDDENTIAGVWGRSSDGSNWKYWYDLTVTRTKSVA